jgi:hypothetical protein
VRRARRVAARLLLFALVGAAATVLVAWGIAIGSSPFAFGEKIRVNERPWEAPEDWAGSPTRLSNSGRGWRVTYWQSELTVVGRHHFGWPRPSLGESEVWGWAATRARVRHHALQIGSGDRSLPLRPLWPGFLVDTAFWGGAAFVVWSAPGFVRRGVRRRRGRCVGCGYELKGLAVCPECGS